MLLLQQLTQILNGILPDAQLKRQLLPDGNGLALYLIDDNFSTLALAPEVTQRVMDNPLYWLFCWASGRVMAQHILHNPEQVKNKIVLDVGSGSDVVAIAAALAGAKKVIAADIDPVAQKAITLNAELNAVSIHVIGDFTEYKDEVDIILIADVLYDKHNFPLLTLLLDRAPHILLADSRVKNFTHPHFQWLAMMAGETFPDLGGFDEFFEVNLYQSC